jgi:hypothetical protein
MDDAAAMLTKTCDGGTPILLRGATRRPVASDGRGL